MASSPRTLLFAFCDSVSLSFLIWALVITTSPSLDCSGLAIREARFLTRIWQVGSTCGRWRRQRTRAQRLLTGSPSRSSLDQRHLQVCRQVEGHLPLSSRGMGRSSRGCLAALPSARVERAFGLQGWQVRRRCPRNEERAERFPSPLPASGRRRAYFLLSRLPSTHKGLLRRLGACCPESIL